MSQYVQYEMDAVQRILLGSSRLNEMKNDIRRFLLLCASAAAMIRKPDIPGGAWFSTTVNLSYPEGNSSRIVELLFKANPGAFSTEVRIDAEVVNGPKYKLLRDDKFSDPPRYLVEPLWEALPQLLTQLAHMSHEMKRELVSYGDMANT